MRIPDNDTSGVADITLEWKNKSPQLLQYLSDTRTVIQAGGNIGIFPIGLSQIFNKVITLEPVTELFYYLEQNTEKHSNIVSLNAGLSDKRIAASVHWQLEGNCGAVRLKEDESGKCSLLTIDSLQEPNIDLIWLDIEGFEQKALLGAKETINRDRPVLILENNGLIHDFPSDLNGSQEFRDWVCREFNYKYVARMMRDDVYLPC